MPTNYPLWEAPEDIPLEERRDFAVCRLLTEKVRAAAADARAAVGRRALAQLPSPRALSDARSRLPRLSKLIVLPNCLTGEILAKLSMYPTRS